MSRGRGGTDAALVTSRGTRRNQCCQIGSLFIIQTSDPKVVEITRLIYSIISVVNSCCLLGIVKRQKLVDTMLLVQQCGNVEKNPTLDRFLPGSGRLPPAGEGRCGSRRQYLYNAWEGCMPILGLLARQESKHNVSRRTMDTIHIMPGEGVQRLHLDLEYQTVWRIMTTVLKEMTSIPQSTKGRIHHGK